MRQSFLFKESESVSQKSKPPRLAVGGRKARDRVGDLVRNLDGVQILYAFGPYLVSKKPSNYLKTEELYDWICVLDNLWQRGG